MHIVKVKQWVFGILLTIVLTPAIAVEPVLPDLGLVDENESVIDRATLAQIRPWILVVVDAHRTLTHPTLTLLEKTAGSWNDAVAILVIGERGSLIPLRAAHEKLIGVRWYRSTEEQLAQKLRIPGVPTILGVSAEQQIVWQESGMPEKAGIIQGVLDRWITPATMDMTEVK